MKNKKMFFPVKIIMFIVVLVWGQTSFATQFTLKSVIVTRISNTIDSGTPQPYVLVQVIDEGDAVPVDSDLPDVTALKRMNGDADCVLEENSVNYNIQLYLQEPIYGRGKIAWESYLRILKVAMETKVPLTLGYMEVPEGVIDSNGAIVVDCNYLPQIFGVEAVGGIQFN